MNKKTLRSIFLAKRKTLSAEAYAARNSAILRASTSFLKAFSAVQHVHIYSSIKSKKEVDTWPIILWLQQHGHQVVLPKMDKSRQLLNHPYAPGDKLVTNNWGIAEPSSEKLITPEEIDMVFLPMICFDQKGNRIGYGGGYYDVFLKKVRNDCLKVGLCLTPPLDLIAYSAPHDIPLDYCITHLRTYSF